MTRREILSLGAAAGLAARLAGLGIGVGYSRWLRPAPPALPAALGDTPGRLVDHEGRAVGFPDLVGRAALVFFGFTSCPDVCPTTLGRIALWLDALGEDVARLTQVFVTVDPARDDAATMAAYVSAFHPRSAAGPGRRPKSPAPPTPCA